MRPRRLNAKAVEWTPEEDADLLTDYIISNQDVQFVHLMHGPGPLMPTGDSGSAVELGLGSELIRKILIKLARLGFYAYTYKEGGTRFVHSDRLGSVWGAAVRGDVVQSDEGIWYSYTGPRSGHAASLLVIFSSMYSPLHSCKLDRFFTRNYGNVERIVPPSVATLRIADVGGVLGSYYLPTCYKPDNGAAISQLIGNTASENGIPEESIVMMGSSKGATGTVYQGLVNGWRFVAVDPILDDQYYVERAGDCHYVNGGVYPQSKAELFAELMHDVAAVPSVSNQPRSVVLTARKSHEWHRNIEFAERFPQDIMLVESSSDTITGHPTVAKGTLNVTYGLVAQATSNLPFLHGRYEVL